ncbi:MAG TPA: pilin [Candidatus Saccharimonadales bacterium]|nr:pilin [Candidatus Saccharimonadales bacterium]
MTHKIKTLLLSLSLLFTFSATALLPAVASAATNCGTTGNGTNIDQTSINCQLSCGSNGQLNSASGGNQSATTCNTNTSNTDFNSVLKKIINILSVIVGAIAVVMVIIGGFRYVTSAGSESGVSGAKKTIMYALIGLVIVALAQVIVHFVLNNLT